MPLPMVTHAKPVPTSDGHTIYGVEFSDGATARVASKQPLMPGQFLNLTPPHPDDLPEEREYEFDGIPVEYLVVEV